MSSLYIEAKLTLYLKELIITFRSTYCPYIKAIKRQSKDRAPGRLDKTGGRLKRGAGIGVKDIKILIAYDGSDCAEAALDDLQRANSGRVCYRRGWLFSGSDSLSDLD